MMDYPGKACSAACYCRTSRNDSPKPAEPVVTPGERERIAEAVLDGCSCKVSDCWFFTLAARIRSGEFSTNQKEE